MKLPASLQKVVDFTKELFISFGKANAFTLGASLAYYTIFSFGPMLVVMISVTSIFVGRKAVTGQLYDNLNELLGPTTAENLQGIVESAYASGDSFWASAIGLATLLFAATTVFNALKTSLNSIWEIESRPDNTIKGLVFDRILSFGMVLGLGFMLLVTLVVNAVVVGFVDQIVQLVPGLGETFLKGFTMSIDLALSTLIFALLFRYLPDAKARWKDIWVGAFFTSFLFLLGKFLIGIYIGNSNFSNTYGAASALITLLVWTYYNSQIVFLGAQFTFVWAKWSSHPILPASHAVRIVKEVKEVNHWDAAEAEGVSQEDLEAR